ncbi:aminodeoxychorismate synthase component I [Maricaulis parjimensis]|uniref:aminodeoxychorismate synthase component I n=1 Tax=Maricaulis parjimensis TaxID=144023 RepID=UPI00193A54A4|nr:aminodeoxychorismate synthase component I [Maricaulis parjimensis]
MANPVLSLPWRDPLAAFAPLSGEAHALLLHDGRQGRARLFARPDAVFEGEGREAFEALAASARDHDALHAGLFGYDLAAAFERLPHLDPRWPPLSVGRYPVWARFDRETDRMEVFAPDRAQADAFLAALGEGRSAPPASAAGAASWTPRWSKATYLEAAHKAKAYIRAGDVFQVNLSQGFDAELAASETPFGVFVRLCAQSPAPHAAFFRLDDDRVVMTNSPERFVEVREGRVEARPIKGTRPRSADPVEDAALSAELEASTKDRAENLMIVDLMRNDLSRVCAAGSVKVPRLCDVETYANVHHLVSVVTGDLAPECDVYDLLGAAFPPGSITGAPKVRAMEIISELEAEPRGPYCGALGWIEGRRAMDLNVMIRTAALRRQADGHWRASVRSGGGIVADSVPEAEFDETLTKASALKRALGAGDD